MTTPVILSGIPALDQYVRGFERGNLVVLSSKRRTNPAEPVVPMDFPKPQWDPLAIYDRVGTVPLLDLVNAMAQGFGGRITVLGELPLVTVWVKPVKVQVVAHFLAVLGFLDGPVGRDEPAPAALDRPGGQGVPQEHLDPGRFAVDLLAQELGFTYPIITSGTPAPEKP